MKKFIAGIFGLLLIAAVVFLVITRLNQPTEEIETVELPMVTLGTIETGDMESTISLMGTVAPSDTYYITPKLSGELQEVYVENGQSVSQGDPIAKIDNDDAIKSAQNSLDQASISATNARNALNRLTPLYQAGDVSQQEYESTKAQADAASSQVSSAQLNYDLQVEYATVLSPADGVIQNLNTSINAMVGPSTQIAVLIMDGAKTIDFNVTEDVMRNLSIGETVQVDKSGVVVEGQISEISQLINAQTGLYEVKAILSDESALADGARAKVTLTSASSQNTNIVPLDYVYYKNSLPYVYIYNGETVEVRDITLGIQNNEYAEVLEGLSAEDQIITSWTKEIYDGASVRISE